MTAPVDEPLTLVDAKEHLRIEADATGEDATLAAYISAAREQAENYCGRAFGEGQFFCKLGALPMGDSPLPLSDPSTVSIVEIRYRDEDGAEHIIPAEDYVLDVFFLAVRPLVDWPDYSTDVVVIFTGGYAADALPHPVRQAMRLLITDFYTNREAQTDGRLYENKAVQHALNPFRVGLGL